MQKPLKDRRPKTMTRTSLSPQAYFDAMLERRGYSTARHPALATAYHNRPTALQLASYDVYLIDLLHRADAAPKLARILAAGVSANPCNAHGESLAHRIGRLGRPDLLQVLLDHGSDVSVADDCGRTPLHDCCWAAAATAASANATIDHPQNHEPTTSSSITTHPWFATAALLLQADPHLLHMADIRGCGPLSYVRRRADWPAWIRFLDSVKNVYWPPRNNTKIIPSASTTTAASSATTATVSSSLLSLSCTTAAALFVVPPLVREAAHARPCHDPAHALTPALARMVVSGRIRPDEAVYLKYDLDDDNINNVGGGRDDDLGSGSGDGDDDDEYDDDESRSDDEFDADSYASESDDDSDVDYGRLGAENKSDRVLTLPTTTRRRQ